MHELRRLLLFFGENDFYDRFFLSTTLSENATSSSVWYLVVCTKYRVQEFKENTHTQTNLHQFECFSCDMSHIMCHISTCALVRRAWADTFVATG